jgi:hypothetical protein
VHGRSICRALALHRSIDHIAVHNLDGERAMTPEHLKLRELAAWYREYAERTENAVIWDARLRTAERLEAEADRIASQHSG